MKIERLIKSFKYSLHDTRVQNMQYEEDNLILYLDRIYFKDSKGKVCSKKGKVTFEKIEDINFLVINDTSSERFKGKYLDINSYIEKYSKSEFEILSEAYDINRVVFQGWLWIDEKKPFVCIMNIYFLGEMIYELEGKEC